MPANAENVNSNSEVKFRYASLGVATKGADCEQQFYLSIGENMDNAVSIEKAFAVKLAYFDTHGNRLHKMDAPNFRNFTFKRLAFQNLETLTRWLVKHDGRYVALCGDFADPAATIWGSRLNKDRGEDKNAGRFVDRANRLVMIDADTIRPSKVDFNQWPEDTSFDMLDRSHWERLGRCLIEAFAPGNGDVQFIIAPTGTAEHSKIKLRLFFMANKPLTLAERRALCGPVLGRDDPRPEYFEPSSHPGFFCDRAITSAPNMLVYLKSRAFTVTDNNRESLNQYISKIQEMAGANKFKAHKLAFEGRYMPENIVALDPYARVRVLFFAGRESVSITDDLLDPARAYREKAKRKDRNNPVVPMTDEDRERLDVTELDDIGGGSGTYPSMRSYTFSQAAKALSTGQDFDAGLTMRALHSHLAKLIEQQKAQGKTERVQTLQGYLARDVDRTVEDAADWFATKAAEYRGAGEGYDVLDEEDDDGQTSPLVNWAPETAPSLASYKTLAEAERLLSAEIEAFRARFLDGQRGVHVLKSGVGLGKSRLARDMVLDLVRLAPDRRIAIHVPTHQLAAEWQAFFDEKAPGMAATYFGRSHKPKGSEHGFCAVSDSDFGMWQKARGSTKSACKRCRFKNEHPNFDGGCPYPRQEERLKAASVHIFAGPQTLLKATPELCRDYSLKSRTADIITSAGMDDDEAMEAAFVYAAEVNNQAGLAKAQYALCVIDETRPEKWLNQDSLDLSKLEREIEPNGWQAKDKAGIMPIEQALDGANAFRNAILNRLEPGLIHRGPAALGAKPAEMLHMMACTRRLKIHGTDDDARRLFGAVEQVERKEARELLRQKGAYCQQVYALADIAHGLHLGGSISIDEFGDKHLVRWSYRAEVHVHWGASALVLDATASLDLLRFFWPELTAAEVNALEPPVAKRFFVAGNAASYGRIAADRLSAVADIDAIMTFLKEGYDASHQRPPVVGIIAPRALVTADEPEGVKVRASKDADGRELAGWFNAVRGLNLWRDVDALLIAGRPLPSRAEVERDAADFQGRTVEGANPAASFPARNRYMFVRQDGRVKVAKAKCWTHPDRIARAVLDSILAAELIQADGRARAVRRGHEVDGWQPDGVTIWHATGCPVPGLVYDEIFEGYLKGGRHLWLDLDSIRANTPAGRVFLAFLKGNNAFDRAAWAEIAGLTDSQYHDLKKLDRHLDLIEEAAADRRAERLELEALMAREQAERQATRTYREIATSLALAGLDLKGKQTKALVQAEVEAQGGLFKADSWRKAVQFERNRA